MGMLNNDGVMHDEQPIFAKQSTGTTSDETKILGLP